MLPYKKSKKTDYVKTVTAERSVEEQVVRAVLRQKSSSNRRPGINSVLFTWFHLVYTQPPVASQVSQA